jgi:LuxR family maltose regulon positive regulatory protein
VAIEFVRQLLPLFDSELTRASASNQAQIDNTLLLNPLTERELVTLRYLASELSIPEIANEMVVAASTVRSYVKRIYSKLDAHSRIEAVNRGRQLKLIV